MAATGNGSKKTLIDLLLADHQAAKSLLEKGPTGTDFNVVVRELVVHEVAEEEIVYPAFRRIGGTDTIAENRIAEQQEAEQLLQKMEHMDTSSAEFKDAFGNLRTAVLAHAQSEESEVFPKLQSSLQAAELQKLGKAYEVAKATAPTHPHPNAPNTPPGNLVLGPVAGLIDRVRDVAREALSKAK